jgi:hypothetical protein
MMINGQREKNVRADKPLMVFARLAFTSPGKNRDKQLTHIVRVSKSAVIFLSCWICPKCTMLFIFFVYEQDLSFVVIEHNFS